MALVQEASEAFMRAPGTELRGERKVDSTNQGKGAKTVLTEIATQLMLELTAVAAKRASGWHGPSLCR